MPHKPDCVSLRSVPRRPCNCGLDIPGEPRTGAFYWIRLRDLATDTTESDWQPAKFTGVDASGIATWDYIGEASWDGHHRVEVVEVGDEIVCPNPPAAVERRAG